MCLLLPKLFDLKEISENNIGPLKIMNTMNRANCSDEWTRIDVRDAIENHESSSERFETAIILFIPMILCISCECFTIACFTMFNP